jgi:hypothetical protein
MTSKCKNGLKKVGNFCVDKKSYKNIKKVSNEINILKIALIGVFGSIGGWLIFTGITGIFNLERLGNLAMIIIGFVLVLLVYKFGYSKIKK